jgi:protein-S-isoprenylcysteine O-methyltransferase
MSDFFQRAESALGLALPPYGVGALIVLLLYIVQAEIRFGARARASAAGPADRGSTIAVSLSMAVPVVGFALAMRAKSPGYLSAVPAWLRAPMPGLPAIAWVGVGMGALGLLVRLWSLLTLRERYTRTLLVHDAQVIERRGPYRFVRHPGYLGSLLCLNGIALASGSWLCFAASIAATFAAYAYRIRVEDTMLIAAFGVPYENYRREVGALLPFLR